MNRLLKRAASLIVATALAVSAGAMSAFAADGPQLDPNQKCTLTIHKYAMADSTAAATTPGTGEEMDVPAGAAPLDGVTFQLYQVAPGYTIPREGVTAAPEGSTPAGEQTTANGGLAAFSGLAQGRYLVMETAAPAHVTEKAAPFIVDLPMTNQAGDKWMYNVHVYPKNATVLGAVQLAKTGDDGKPLAGAVFQLQQRQEDGTYVTVGSDLTTDANGHIAVNNLLVGSYQFIEKSAPDGYGLDTTPVQFTVTKTGSIAQDGTQAGTVILTGMQNFKTPDIHKAVSVDGGQTNGQHAGAAIAGAVTWTVTPTVPKNIEAYTKYIVTDEIDPRLNWKGNVKVQASADNGKSWTDLEKDKDYTLVQPEENAKGGSLAVTFIDGKFTSGRAALSGRQLRILFDTQLNGDAAMGTEIPNQAALHFNNGVGTEGDTESERPEVHTGGLKFLKYATVDGKETGLEGAAFKLYASEADAKADKDAIASAVSGKDGSFEFTGLAYGNLDEPNATASRDYWLVETKAPAGGYQLQAAPRKVTVNATSYSGQQVVKIENRKGPSLPLTGAGGLWPFLAAGAGIAVLAAFGFRRKANA